MPAVCHNLNCDYVFTEPTGEVTSFTFDSATKKVVLTGTGFPTNVYDYTSAEFALSPCTINPDTITATNIECTLDHEPTCGNFKPILKSNLGFIPIAASLASSSVQCTITSAVPLTNLNLLGEDNIVLTGTNFPRDLASSTFEIKFSDV